MIKHKKESDVKMKKEIIINGEIFGSIDIGLSECDFNIPIQKGLNCGMAYLIEFEITDFAECKGIVQLEGCENDIECWFFNVKGDEVIECVFKGKQLSIYNEGIYLYNKMIKDRRIPTEFRLEPSSENEDMFVLMYFARITNAEGITLEIARDEDYSMLIDISETLAEKFPTLENLIMPEEED